MLVYILSIILQLYQRNVKHLISDRSIQNYFYHTLPYVALKTEKGHCLIKI